MHQNKKCPLCQQPYSTVLYGYRCNMCQVYYSSDDLSYYFNLNNYMVISTTNLKVASRAVETRLANFSGRHIFQINSYFEFPKSLEEAKTILNKLLLMMNFS